MLTCLTCQVVFADATLQIKHFQTEWHKYNLKRKVAGLPALRLEQYNERIEAQKIKEEEEQGPKRTYCDFCRKAFVNKNSFLNHSKSKKHLENMEKRKDMPIKNSPSDKSIEEDTDDEDLEVEEVDSDEWEGDPIPPKHCLFCPLESKSLEANLKHMTKVHSFFVPDLKFCNDLEGLITYLGEKVGVEHICLWCNTKGRRFYTVEAVQAHMEDKGHCMMLFEKDGIIEYSEYYDYSSSYPDADDPNINPDDVVEPSTLCDNGYELMLPSGVVIGHRSLLRYYKQRLNPNRSLVLHKGQPSSMHRKMLEHYKSLGLKESTKAEIVSKARDINYMKKMQSKQFLKLGVKANKFQTHFRPQVQF